VERSLTVQVNDSIRQLVEIENKADSIYMQTHALSASVVVSSVYALYNRSRSSSASVRMKNVMDAASQLIANSESQEYCELALKQMRSEWNLLMVEFEQEMDLT
jgi:hypothetical protein